ncbi:MAG TPA: TonB-dependent receptor, partial [Oceanipulchritudo sp.]|nr:TonB-dependent receptor [Oceanipulchritudo sp.]
SPFEVDTSSDRGYYAANTISGSRINVALQDMPMPIEVITSEFIEDTGSLNLRDSLKYSAGVLLSTQSPRDGVEGVPGGVHNGEGASANITDTTFKMRGFITESSLRKGFRRQHGSDSINIDRIEVVRGPAALLYGIGNFGGIVNYMPKRPLTYQQTAITALVGSDQQYRATLDTTGPLSDVLSYRLTAAAEDANHWTDIKNSNSLFFSPVIVYKPFEKTKITLDVEVGTNTTNGIGFQTMRARATGLEDPTGDQVINQQGRLQKGGFVVFDGIDNRTFRLSGPDTYLTTDASNVLLEIEQNIMDGLDLMVGYNRAVANVDMRDIVNNAYNTGFGPANLRSTVKIEPFTDQSGSPVYDAEIGEDTLVEDAVLMYHWQDQMIDQTREEYKVELTYSFELFKDSKWLNHSHMFLAGVSDLEQEKMTQNYVTGGQTPASFLYKDPNDHSLIRFGQGVLRDVPPANDPDYEENPDGINGFPPLLQTKQTFSVASNKGYYGVWQGRFWENRITTIVGVREDSNSQEITDYTFENGSQTDISLTSPEGQSEVTNQYGITVEVLNGVSIFALKSEGLEPNFDGLRDGYGAPISGTKAESEEIGVKLLLLDGKLAATMSAYKINVVGPTSIGGGGLWWGPAPAKGRYDPTKPTVYDVSWAPVDDTNDAHVANIGLWNAAVAAGQVRVGSDGQTYLTVLDANGNDTAGAAYLDAMYAWAAAGKGWPGWFFAGSSLANTEANNAAMDWSAGDVDYFASMVGEEESTGFEIQLLYSPNENWQIYVSYANTQREIINQGKMPKYPYPQDRWAQWYFPDGNWGLQGATKEEAYGDPQDTSTWTGGPASTNGESLDDTPEHDFSFWTSYSFTDGPLTGLKLGLGGQYESEREYLSGFTVGGDAVTDSSGKRIKLYTDTKLQFDAMARYDMEWKDMPVFFQLNIDNLTDDKDLYGYVYESGISWRLQAGITF